MLELGDLPNGLPCREKEATKDEESTGPARILKGVMRVGVLAKGLLLRGDSEVNLVVLCAEKPTTTLLAKVGQNLPEQLSVSIDEKIAKGSES